MQMKLTSLWLFLFFLFPLQVLAVPADPGDLSDEITRTNIGRESIDFELQIEQTPTGRYTINRPASTSDNPWLEAVGEFPEPATIPRDCGIQGELQDVWLDVQAAAEEKCFKPMFGRDWNAVRAIFFKGEIKSATGFYYTLKSWPTPQKVAAFLEKKGTRTEKLDQVLRSGKLYKSGLKCFASLAANTVPASPSWRNAADAIVQLTIETVDTALFVVKLKKLASTNSWATIFFSPVAGLSKTAQKFQTHTSKIAQQLQRFSALKGVLLVKWSRDIPRLINESIETCDLDAVDNKLPGLVNEVTNEIEQVRREFLYYERGLLCALNSYRDAPTLNGGIYEQLALREANIYDNLTLPQVYRKAGPQFHQYFGDSIQTLKLLSRVDRELQGLLVDLQIIYERDYEQGVKAVKKRREKIVDQYGTLMQNAVQAYRECDYATADKLQADIVALSKSKCGQDIPRDDGDWWNPAGARQLAADAGVKDARALAEDRKAFAWRIKQFASTCNPALLDDAEQAAASLRGMVDSGAYRCFESPGKRGEVEGKIQQSFLQKFRMRKDGADAQQLAQLDSQIALLEQELSTLDAKDDVLADLAGLEETKASLAAIQAIIDNSNLEDELAIVERATCGNADSKSGKASFAASVAEFEALKNGGTITSACARYGPGLLETQRQLYTLTSRVAALNEKYKSQVADDLALAEQYLGQAKDSLEAAENSTGKQRCFYLGPIDRFLERLAKIEVLGGGGSGGSVVTCPDPQSLKDLKQQGEQIATQVDSLAGEGTDYQAILQQEATLLADCKFDSLEPLRNTLVSAVEDSCVRPSQDFVDLFDQKRTTRILEIQREADLLEENLPSDFSALVAACDIESIRTVVNATGLSPECVAALPNSDVNALIASASSWKGKLNTLDQAVASGSQAVGELRAALDPAVCDISSANNAMQTVNGALSAVESVAQSCRARIEQQIGDVAGLSNQIAGLRQSIDEDKAAAQEALRLAGVAIAGCSQGDFDRARQGLEALQINEVCLANDSEGSSLLSQIAALEVQLDSDVAILAASISADLQSAKSSIENCRATEGLDLLASTRTRRDDLLDLAPACAEKLPSDAEFFQLRQQAIYEDKRPGLEGQLARVKQRVSRMRTAANLNVFRSEANSVRAELADIKLDAKPANCFVSLLQQVASVRLPPEPQRGARRRAAAQGTGSDNSLDSFLDGMDSAGDTSVLEQNRQRGERQRENTRSRVAQGVARARTNAPRYDPVDRSVYDQAVNRGRRARGERIFDPNAPVPRQRTLTVDEILDEGVRRNREQQGEIVDRVFRGRQTGSTPNTPPTPSPRQPAGGKPKTGGDPRCGQYTNLVWKCWEAKDRQPVMRDPTGGDGVGASMVDSQASGCGCVSP